MTDAEPGAYGLRIHGLAGATDWMQPQSPGAPSLRLRLRVGETSDLASRYDAESADIRLLDGGRLQARRGTGTVDYMVAATPPDEDLLHPYLAPAAALVWRWFGREAIHAGVFANRRGAVLVLGGKEAGKSTTLAWLADAGVTILADDLAVIDGNRVLTGPRSIDLRPPSAPVSGGRQVRGGGRSRVQLPPAPDRVPVVGVAVLEWGPSRDISTVPVEQRWPLIVAQRSFPGLVANGTSLLEIVAVPTLRFTRPPDLASVAETGRALIDVFS